MGLVGLLPHNLENFLRRTDSPHRWKTNQSLLGWREESHISHKILRRGRWCCTNSIESDERSGRLLPDVVAVVAVVAVGAREIVQAQQLTPLAADPGSSAAPLNSAPYDCTDGVGAMKTNEIVREIGRHIRSVEPRLLLDKGMEESVVTRSTTPVVGACWDRRPILVPVPAVPTPPAAR
jgi:hypothetical protein